MSAPGLLVRTHHRRLRNAALVWSLALALLAVCLVLAERLAWVPSSAAIAAGAPAAASIFALTLWLTHARHLKPDAVARTLDVEWKLKARLETAAELATVSSALAAAQRADTTSLLAGRRPPRAAAWHAGQIVLWAAVLLFLAESTAFGVRRLSQAASQTILLPEDKTREEPVPHVDTHATPTVLAAVQAMEANRPRVASSSAPPAPPPGDPLSNTPDTPLPPRKSTPAGQLEELEKEQSDQAGSLDGGKKSTSSKKRGASSENTQPPPAAAQEALARRATALAKDRQLSPSAQKALEQAARDATRAAAQLKQRDVAAARAPAHAAAEALRRATAEQEKTGRETARVQLETSRRSLHDAAAGPHASDRAARIAEIAARLQADARAQQESGSAEAARQLAAAAAETAKASRSSESNGTGNVRDTLSPADQAAQAAASSQAALSERVEALDRALRQLERGSHENPATKASATGAITASTELILGAQLAHAILGTPESARDSTALVNAFRPSLTQSPAIAAPELHAATDSLRRMLVAARSDNRRNEVVRSFNPEDFDPAYRPAIERYFERLSREARHP